MSVAAPGEDGTREVSVFSRLESGEGEEEPWALNAEGTISPEGAPAPEPLAEWPPEGAERLDVEELGDRLADAGLELGPAFDCLTAAWRRGDEAFAELSLAEDRHADAGFALHPALLEASAQAGALAAAGGEPGLAAAWRGVSVHAVGATELRLRLGAPEDGTAAAIELFEPSGSPVARIAAAGRRPVSEEQLRRAARRQGLLEIEWRKQALPEPAASAVAAETWRWRGDASDDPAAEARRATAAALKALQAWLGREHAEPGERLAVLTEGAVAAAPGEAPDPAAAAVWGLVRSAQIEHPNSFLLIDTEGREASDEESLAAALAQAEEPQLALREGAALVPRANRLAAEETDGGEPFDPERTVLLTGATGALGAQVARHMVEAQGARHLLLVSRRGADAPGTAELRAELERQGAEVTIAACDVADREALAALLDSLGDDHPLGAVVHVAGVVDDATIESLTPDRLDPVFAPKADAAWAMHELTADLDLSHFVLFSSAAGALGGPGQGNYAAANSFLDALAALRRARGLPATSIAWGMWEGGGMGAALEEADRSRMRQGGFAPLSAEQGLDLLDGALRGDRAAVLAVRLEPAALRGLASLGVLPPVFSELVRAPRRRAGGSSLAHQLAELPEAERQGAVLELVRSQVAAVLGHPSSEAIEPDRAFSELGFDSLAALELRNRLGLVTGVPLSATVVFDHPSAAALAAHLLEGVAAAAPAGRTAVRAQASDEPIAIVGLACRYPGGVGSPEELWRLVASGGDAIEAFPDDRGWDLERLYDPNPDSFGTSYVREGGFLAGATEFDPEFFNISPREAALIDPQQRLLLEGAWEALEHAGIDPATLRGEPAGVFAGVSAQDYGNADFGIAPGLTTSVVSGRVAYALGLEGPAMTVDTACSSSLVATHLAAQALRGGECDLALAGGVTVIATPAVFTLFSAQRGLAADGRSKSFAEAADGTSWSEGLGMLVLERLSDAEANGHRVLATIRGSAVNQDGASNGLSAPNGPSQERVIRQALANARLEPGEVDMLEAHGTGTTLGDPIEAGALLATYGQDRERPLKLGSLKSNIGHAQAAAGVGGVIKAVLAMRAGTMPKTLHVDQPSTKVEWAAGRIELLTEAEPWEPNGHPRRAGVSSFGYSGTNAHLILEEGEEAPSARGADSAPEASPAGDAIAAPEAPERSPGPLAGAIPLPLSAKTEDALRDSAARLATHLRDHPDQGLLDTAYSLATTRTPFEHRAVAVVGERNELLTSLDALAAGASPGGPSTAAPPPALGRASVSSGPVFAFGGQGSQYARMALGLVEASPAFARAIGECEAALEPHVDWSLSEVLREAEGKWMERLDIVQPALFATMVSLARLWEACGVRPSLLIGHSQGEVAAAHIAGALSLQDAARVIALRSQAMAKIAGKGAMASLSLPVEQAGELLAPYGESLSLAAINGPSTQAISGEPEAIAELIASCEAKDIRARPIAVDYAAHSSQIEDLRDELLEAFAPISPTASEIPLHSTLTGELLDTSRMDASYWYRNLRETVLFYPVIESLLGQGRSHLIEISPHPVLSFGIQEAIEAKEADANVIATLRRDERDATRFALSLGEAHAAGVQVDWESFFAGSGAKRVPLPTYPFQRKRYWIGAARAVADLDAAGLSAADHPLLGAAVEDPSGEGLTLTGRLSLASHPWLADHAVAGTVIFPGAAFLELALHAGERVGAAQVEELALREPLVLPERGAVRLQVTVDRSDQEGRRAIRVHSRPAAEGDGEEPWTLHAEGLLSEEAPATLEPLEAWPPPAAEPLDAEYLYDRLAEASLEHGPAFQVLERAWRRGEEVFAELALNEDQSPTAAGFAVHPALLDGTLHAAALAALEAGGEAETQQPAAWRGAAVSAAGPSALRVRIDLSGDSLELALADREGRPLGAVAGLELEPVSAGQLREAARRRDSLLAVEWVELSEAPPAAAPEPTVWRHEPPDRDPSPTAARRAAAAALTAIQEWLAREDAVPGERLAIVTSGAVAAKPGETPDPAAAAIWGLVRSAQGEHPDSLLLVDTDGGEASEQALPAALAQTEEPQFALREGALLVPRATRLPRPEPGAEPAPTLDPERTVLVTGATGVLGALTARHLAGALGARRLLLVSRSGEDAPGAAELRRELEALGAEPTIVACDVADRAALEELLASIPAAHPLGAVFHTAGALDDATIESLTPDRLDPVFAPKADAAWALHELTADLDLSHFVLFSSAAGTMSSPGQGNYAAANAYCDALAAHRAAQGPPATSIAWGYWETTSALTEKLGQADLSRMRAGGLAPISDARGLALLDLALATPRPDVLAIGLDPAGLRGMASVGALPPLLSGLTRVARRPAIGGEFARRLAELPEAERQTAVLELVRSQVAAVLGHASAEEVDVDRAFAELGFDSLAALDLRNRIGLVTGARLAATAAFDHPTAAELAAHLYGQIAARGTGRAAVAAQGRTSEDPIAIVGMACRFPGGDSPAAFWELIEAGGDATGPFPADRGWDVPQVRGGFLPDVGDFDPGFFAISPREARAIDPQQRLLLEVAWQALEAAGIDPGSLRGGEAGVFVGAGATEYQQAILATGQGAPIVGGSSSVVSGRVAYTLGLTGPAITVDTACSSSLVAAHLASQALRGGECDLAIVGGVSVFVTPVGLMDFSNLGGLAADGHCKAFAEAADGTAFAEGAGVVLLERLSDAEANGHRVLATIRGSALNQDGASNGLTAPNGPSQERVIRQALANAGLEPGEVDLLEAHGTGTTLGDPIEAGALLATYGGERQAPLRVGSVKSNIGHTSTAAGIAGLIKAVLAMRAGVMPKTLHVDAPSSKVEWGAGGVELLTEALPWEANGRPRRAAVSSFGISGTNAHLILEQGEETPADPDQGSGAALPLALSAKSEAALRESASRLKVHLEANPTQPLLDTAYSLLTTRGAFEHRAVAVGTEREELLGALEAIAAGEPSASVASARARPGRTAYLLTGQGSQRPGMGQELYETYPAYAEALDQALEQIDRHLERQLRDLLFAAPGSDEAKLLNDTTYAQPALFATHLALQRLFEGWGLEPDLLAGHSVGEISAAHISGVLSLPDAARLICARGALMGALPAGGAMLAIGAGEAEVAEAIEGMEADLSLAATNSPTSTVISGRAEAIDAQEAHWSEREVKTKRLAVSHAFHSPLIEPMIEEFAEVAKELTYAEPTIPIVSNLSGELLTAVQATDPAYWVSHVRAPVRFADGVRTLMAQGATTFLELGPDPVLTAMAAECLAAEERPPALIPTLRDGRPEPEAAILALGAAHAAGAGVEWRRYFAASDARRVELPTYPFQRKRYWPEQSDRPVGNLLELVWREHPLPGPGDDGQPARLWRLEPAAAGASPPEVAREASARALAEIQAWLGREEPVPGERLAILTRGAPAVSRAEAPDPAAAAVWGLVRSAQSEHPGSFLLIDTDGSEASDGALPAALAQTEEPQLALRAGIAFVPRATPLADEGEGEGAPLDPERTVLVTGGTGALGAAAARHLVAAHGARRLLLAGRRGEDAPGAARLRDELEQLGAEVEIAACDVADRAALAALLDSIPPERPLGAVVHAAGAIQDATIESLEPASFGPVFGPKLDAAWALHELTAESDLSHFVLYSSAAGVIGGPGQGNYAAANAFCDALAAWRRARSLPATSIAWGLWEGGMGATLDEADVARIRQGGLTPLSTERGLALLDRALASERPELLALDLDPAALREMAAVGALPPLLGELAGAPGPAAAGELARQLAGLPEAEREPAVLELVRVQVAAVLGHESSEAIEPERAFSELGFDSLAALELRNRLALLTGVPLATTAVFDYPSARALAARLLEGIGASGPRRRAVVRAQASDESVAIVGMACRYPGGVASPEDLWRLLEAGGDAIASFPDDRGWDLERLRGAGIGGFGEGASLEGGFLYDAAEFDPEFFNVSPREAVVLDPQQRLFLEGSWEALEDAGIDPATLRGQPAGVFAGISFQDYGAAEIGVSPGMSGSSVSGRVSYALGLEGPAITVDTACSSSLVAAHLAAQALRGGECEVALVGGVTVISTPSVFTLFSAQGGLSPDGRCRAFAEAADGTGFAEGIGVLVLERLSDAEANGHRVLATIRGSAVNQDGASNGFSAPNGPSQERVILQALANARLQPGEVEMVEAHGTGTTLGDPIEAGALLATYGQDRESPLKLGSLKSNIGHTQAAAGVAGVIKAVMAMRAGLMPKTLHVDAPSSKVEWGAGEIELLTEAEPWEPNGHPRRAGVSSFGYSGTNAHLILEQGPEPTPPAETCRRKTTHTVGQATARPQATVPLSLSAKSPEALRESAARLAAHLEANPEQGLTDTAHSLLSTRGSFEHRAVAVGTERQELLEALGAIASGEPSPAVASGRARSGRTAYLLTGQGSQRPGMGQELYETFPAYAEALDQALEQIDPRLERPLRDLLFAEPGSDEAKLLNDTTYAQPALFATHLALQRLFESWGLVPELLAGHSVGEISAAHISGVLSLPDAARLICARGALMGALPAGGAMLAIGAGEAEVAEAIEGMEADLSLAAINSPTSTVISGRAEAIDAQEAHWSEREVKTKRLAVSHAFHSPLIEPMIEEFAEVAGSLTYGEPQLPIVSNLTGEILAAEQATDPAYWVSHVRAPVRFADGVRTLMAQGATTLVELGPDPVLTAMAAECLAAEERPPALIPTLREGRDEPEAAILALGAAHVAGATVAWQRFFAGSDPKRAALPTYPFQRKRYWLTASSASASGDPASLGLAGAHHPLLGAAIEDPAGETLTLTGRISLATHPWLAEHALAGTAILPGSALLDLALRAAEGAGCGAVAHLDLREPLVLPPEGAVQLRVAVAAPDEGGDRAVQIHARPEPSESRPEHRWTLHAEGALAREPAPVPEECDAWPPEGAEPLDPMALCDRLAEAGLDRGPSFRGIRGAWQHDEELFLELATAEEKEAEAAAFRLHPGLLDAALQAGFERLARGSSEGSAGPCLARAFRDAGVSIAGRPALRARVTAAADGISLALFDREGTPLGALGTVLAEELDSAELRRAASLRAMHRLEWIEVQSRAPVAPAGLAIIGEATLEGLGSAPLHADLASLRASIAEGAAAPDAVVLDARAWSGEGAGAGAVRAATERALATAQEWLAAGELAATRLVFLTARALVTAPGEDPDLVLAPLAGFAGSAHSERPDRFALVDLDGSPEAGEALPSALALVDEEPQIAVRAGRLLAPRLAAAPEAPAEAPAPRPLDPERTVLVTGGTGGLGAVLSRRLVLAHGVRHLLLLSRRGAEAPGAPELRAELEELGAHVEIAACDVTDRAALEEVLAGLADERPLGAVVHCAAVFDDATLESQSGERLDRVMRPKVDAALSLHELTRGADLSHFVLFSSAAGIVGGAGQAAYAAANVFGDALAAHRRAAGLPATSLAWGLWLEQVVAAGALRGADHETVDRYAQQVRMRLGFAPLGTEQGLDLFDAALARPEHLLAPVPFDAAALRSRAAGGSLAAVLRGLAPAPAPADGPGGDGALALRLGEVPEPERPAVVLDLVRGHTAAVLGHPSAAAIEPDRAFSELGFDSLAALELRNRLSAAAGVRLDATAIFDHPSARALADHLLAAATADGAAPRVAVRSQASDEPVAIVGMACRYPGGVASPADLWRLLVEGRDAVGPFPADRGVDPDELEGVEGATVAGGFLADAGGFDPGFFGIAPREALSIDPQQRLLLEGAWEALEDAALDPTALRGTETGVFIGASAGDYSYVANAAGIASSTTDRGLSVISGRIAYALGLVGPTMTVDTACSSSLVALHLAAGAVRAGECGLALVGGVSVFATPFGLLDVGGAGGLAADGRCKSFAEAADGTSFAEGSGMLVLERLADARAAGHRVLAIVRGSAVNQDGASNGLTAPNGPSQERVILQALANAGLEPDDVDAVEAHGTGTTLGDPIEAGALLGTYGRERERPLWLGSIKSNIGHAAAAAGVAGVIKSVLGMREGLLPRTLHVDAPSSKIRWDAGPVELLTEPVEWEANGRPRRAGVSAFGISGTNAHVIVEQAPVEDGLREEGSPRESAPTREPALPGAPPLVLSAKSPEALPEMAARLLERLERDPEPKLGDVAYSLALTRARFEHRAVAAAADRDGQLAALRALAAGDDSPHLLRGAARADQQPVFLFPGQGSQWAGMGVQLLAESATFERAFAECEEALAPHLEWSLREALAGGPEAPSLDRVDVVQPALFAIMVSLARLWEACGVRPGCVVGHSQGEIAAAHVAGALSLADASRVVALRARAMAKLSGKGAMASLALPLTEAEELLAPYGDRLSLAALNGPASQAISGEPRAIEELLAECERRGVHARRIAVDYAAHSAQIEALEEELLTAFAPIAPRSSPVPLYSTLTGEAIDTATMDASYWYRNLRQRVLLEPVVGRLLDRGQSAFLEVSPHPVLGIGVEEAIEQREERATVVAGLRRDEGGAHRFARALAQAHASGVAVEWEAFFAGSGAAVTPLPTYPFQRERYWPAGGDGRRGAGLMGIEWRPLDLGAAGGDAVESWACEVDCDDADPPARARALAAVALARLQEWVADPARAEERLAILTRGAVAAAPGGRPDPAFAAVWGLVRAAQTEHPGRFVLVDDDGSEALAAALPAALATGEPQLALRDGAALVPRAVRLEAPEDGGDDAPPAIDPERTVLLTGATGVLGALTAKHLVAAHGVRHLLLVSRRGGEAPGAAELAAELEALGAEVALAACDVADRDALEELLAAIPAERPLGAVVHAAGALDDATIESLSPERFDPVFAPKLDAAWSLHELTRDLDLSAFVCFSAAAGILGGAGQGNYAAANVFLDALAGLRRAEGLVATSIAWGYWESGSGMTERLDDGAVERMRRGGIAPISDERGLALLDEALASERGEVVAIAFDREALKMLASVDMLPSLLGELVDVPRGAGPNEELARKLAELPADERRRAVRDLVHFQAAQVLGHESAAQIDPARELVELGFDSLAAVELRNRIVAITGLSVPVFALANSPTVDDVFNQVIQLLEAFAADEAGTTPPAAGGAGVVALLGRAVDEARLEELRDLIRALVGFRTGEPEYGADGPASRLLSLARGPGEPALVTLHSAIAISGPHEHARLAAAFDGGRRVLASPLLGFRPNDPLPADLSAAVAVHVDAILDAGFDSGFALLGNSSGGWLAHSVAAALERAGAPAAALILLDPYWPAPDRLDELSLRLLTWMRDAEAAGFTVDDDRIAAMVAYLDAFKQWAPEELSTPTTVLRARVREEGDALWPIDPLEPTWEAPHTRVDVEGGHMSILQDHAEETAATIRKILANLTDNTSDRQPIEERETE